MEDHTVTVVAGECGSGNGLDELDRGGATFAIDRGDVCLQHTVRSEKRNDGVDRCSPLVPQRDLELLQRRLQVRHDETNVKERVVDGPRRQFDLHPDVVPAYIQDDTDTASACQVECNTWVP